MNHQERSRLQAEDDQGAEHDGGAAGAGDAQRDQRNQGARHGGVVRGFRAGETGDRSVAELFRMLGQFAFEGIGQEGGHRGAGARQDADEGADHRASRGRGRGLADLAHAGDVVAHPEAGPAQVHHEVLLDVEEDLAQTVEADDDGDEVDALDQFGDEGETHVARHVVAAEGADQGAEHGDDQRLDDIVAGQQDDGAEPHHHQHEIFGCAQVDGVLGDDRREEDKDDQAEGAADERAEGGDAEGQAAAPLAHHRIAFERGDDGRRVAGRIDEDRGDAPAVHGAQVDAGQQAQSRDVRHAEGQRQHQGDARRRPEAGQGADDGADHAGDEDDGQVVGRQDGVDPGGQVDQ